MSSHRSQRVSAVLAALCVAGCSGGTPPGSSSADAAKSPSVASTPAEPATAPAPGAAATLPAYEWQLTAATDGTGQSIAALFPSPTQPLGLLFADGRLSVNGGCNRMNAGYQMLDDGQMQVSPGQSTLMACPPPLAEADAAIAKFLTGTLQVAVEDQAGTPQLRLSSADGNTLSFAGKPTPETRFGNVGTRAFLEVSTEPCPAPSAPACLMVRDIHFDENGLRSGEPGDWRTLPGGIEGYAPAEGQQQVVRVKRFEQADPAGSAPMEHFVLDMVVETRTVQ